MLSQFSRRTALGSLLGGTLGWSVVSSAQNTTTQTTPTMSAESIATNESTANSTDTANPADTENTLYAADVETDVKNATTEPFMYAFNTATILGQQLPLPEEIEIVRRAGYGGIEPWCRKIHEYVEHGGTLTDIRKQLEDARLSVVGAIAFGDWCNDDAERRRKGLEEVRRDMEAVAAIGGTAIAAPPGGLYNVEKADLYAVAERFGKVCEIGREIGVRPRLELWGGSKTLSRLGEVAFVLAECGDPLAECCLDAYHTYKGGSDFAGMTIFNGRAIGGYHLNDYPADPPREKIGDGDRVMPGDGVAPLGQILRILYEIGYRGALSLEIFSQEYFQKDAYAVAMEGLAKMKFAVQQAFTAE